MQRCKGFTLVELMTTVSILATLSIITIPNYSNFITSTRVEREISELYRLLLITRNVAINSGTPITVCPINEGNECISSWDKPIIVFQDQNNNGVLDKTSGEVIIKYKGAIKEGDKLLYGKGRTKIGYEPTGRLEGWGQNGTFRYCPKIKPELAKGIRVAVSGRIYKTSDSDYDGKDEVRSGSELSCN